MIVLALDLSFESTGICIADTETRQLRFHRLTPKSYEKVTVPGKYSTATYNATSISDTICKLLMPYRFQIAKTGLHVVIESIGFGFKNRNSTNYLLFEGGIVGSTMLRVFGAKVDFIEPSKHKKIFTGKGKATKEDSVRQMFNWFPRMAWQTEKLDDLADAVSLMTCAVPDIRFYDYTVTCT